MSAPILRVTELPLTSGKLSSGGHHFLWWSSWGSCYWIKAIASWRWSSGRPLNRETMAPQRLFTRLTLDWSFPVGRNRSHRKQWSGRVTWFLESLKDINYWPELGFLGPLLRWPWKLQWLSAFGAIQHSDPGLPKRHSSSAKNEQCWVTQDKLEFTIKGGIPESELLVQRTGSTKQFFSLKSQVQHDEQMVSKGQMLRS